MILSKKPISLAEVKPLLKNLEEKKTLEEYFKKFNTLSLQKARECESEIRGLKNPKISEETVIKLVDFLPTDTLELAKVFNDISLSEEESNALLAILKKY